MADISLGILPGSISPRAGGLFQSVRIPARRMERYGIRPTVYGLRDAQTSESLAEWSGVETVVHDPVGPLRLGFSLGLRHAVMQADHDILHLHFLWSHASAITHEWHQRTGGPVVIAPRGMLDPWALRQSWLTKRIALCLYESQNLRSAATIHVLTDAEAAAVRSFGLTNPIATIPNGIDLPNLGASCRAEKDGKRILLFLGRIHPKKGVAELLAGWKQMATIEPGLAKDWRLVVGGWDDGKHLMYYRKIAEEIGLDITFPGPAFGAVKEKLLRQADAFVLPSHSEGLPMSVLEAWSYGLPVLMSKACNLPIGFEREAALRVDPEGPERMGRALVAALSRNDHGAIGGRGRSLVKERYNWDTVTAQMRSLYDWTLGGGERPSFVHSA